MVGDVTCSPCQGEGRRFEPGVPLQIARIPRAWRVRVFHGLRLSWRRRPFTTVARSKWILRGEPAHWWIVAMPFPGSMEQGWNTCLPLWSVSKQSVVRVFEKTLRPLVKTVSDQAINIRYLRTYASSV
jgi:hypothetical protein